MDYSKLYSDFLRKFLKPKRKLKVIFDCFNGTSGIILKKILNNESGIKNKELKSIIHNSEFIILNSRPDGNFPAHGPNPMIPGAMDELKKRVKKEKADLGVAFDADGDRVFFVDNLGRQVDAHEAGYILAQIFKSPFVVSEIASWRLKNLKPKNQNLKPVYISPVGHYFFKNLMRKKKASLGLEHSGHFYFKDFFYCDSGILAAIQMMNFVSGLSGGLAEWLDALPKYHRSGEINFKVKDKEKILDKIEKIYGKKADKISKLDGLTLEFRGGHSTSSGQNSKEFWFNVRASNTENLLRLNVEATSDSLMKKILKDVSALISRR